MNYIFILLFYVLFTNSLIASPFTIKIHGNYFKMYINTAEDYYDFTVYWGDGKKDTYKYEKSTDDIPYSKHYVPIEHDYVITDEYVISIVGHFTYFSQDNYTTSFATLNTTCNITEVVSWGNIEWKSFTGTFKTCDKLKKLPLTPPNLSKVTSMSEMFYGTKNFNQDISDWDVSNVTNMSGMFCCAFKFNQPLNDWDVSQVRNMESMFSCATNFNQPLDKWDVSNVTNMNMMFYKAPKFNQDISNWNVSNVTSAHSMFSGAASMQEEYKPKITIK